MTKSHFTTFFIEESFQFYVDVHKFTEALQNKSTVPFQTLTNPVFSTACVVMEMFSSMVFNVAPCNREIQCIFLTVEIQFKFNYFVSVSLKLGKERVLFTWQKPGAGQRPHKRDHPAQIKTFQ